MSNRQLMLFPRLDIYVECFSSDEANVRIHRGWIDVTGDSVHEQLFKLYQAQK